MRRKRLKTSPRVKTTLKKRKRRLRPTRKLPTASRTPLPRVMSRLPRHLPLPTVMPPRLLLLAVTPRSRLVVCSI